MFVIARETGWREQFILWELPFFRFLRYQHCHWRSLEIDCFWPGGEKAQDRFAGIAARWSAQEMQDCAEDCRHDDQPE